MLRRVMLARRWTGAFGVLVLLTVSGCGSNSLGKVFPTNVPPEAITFHARVGQMVNIELPTPVPLHTPVRLTSATMTSLPPGARLERIVAYRYDDTGGGAGVWIGNLPTMYPDRFKPSPVTAVTMKPGRISAWYLEGIFTWTRPAATVRIPPIHLTYVDARGRHGSQDMPTPLVGTIRPRHILRASQPGGA